MMMPLMIAAVMVAAVGGMRKEIVMALPGETLMSPHDDIYHKHTTTKSIVTSFACFSDIFARISFSMLRLNMSGLMPLAAVNKLKACRV